MSIDLLVLAAYAKITDQLKYGKRYLGRIDQELGLRINCSESTVRRLRNGHLEKFAAETIRSFFEELGQWAHMDVAWWEDVSASVGFPIGTLEEPLPPTVDETRFVGRETELKDALDRLSRKGPAVVGIDGQGGIGKTRLARQIIAHSQAQNLFEHIIAISAKPEPPRKKSTITLETILDKARQKLRAPGASRAELLSLLTRQHTLFVLDNLETAQQRQSELMSQLEGYLGTSKLLATSRHRFAARNAIHLRGLDEQSAFQFIQDYALQIQFEHLQLDRKRASQIIAKTGGSPLALRFVVAQLRLDGLEDVLQRLAHLPSLTTLSNDENDRAENDEYVHFYKQIFEYSWKRLSENGRLMLLGLAHVSDKDGITLSDLRDVMGGDWDRRTLAVTRGDVWRKSFLEIKATNGVAETRYYLHRLVRTYIESEIVQI